MADNCGFDEMIQYCWAVLDAEMQSAYSSGMRWSAGFLAVLLAVAPAWSWAQSGLNAPVVTPTETDLFAGYCYGHGLMASTMLKGLSSKQCTSGDKDCNEVRDTAAKLVGAAEASFEAANKFLKARGFFAGARDSPAAKAAFLEAEKGGKDVFACVGIGSADGKPDTEACARKTQCADVLILRLDTDPDSVVRSAPTPLPPVDKKF